MNYLAEVCLLGLGVGGKYVRCLVAVFISMGFESAKRCEEGFKVLIFRGVGGGVVQGDKPQTGDQFLWGS